MKFSLKGIIAISGKPGLYKVVAQGNQNLIVESLIDRKRTPAYSSSKVSALDEITMYTTDEDMSLPDIIQGIYEKENGGPGMDPKDEANHRGYFKEIVPNYDEERVYGSDIKKLFSWYTLLHSSGELKRIAEEAKAAAEEEAAAEKAEGKETKAKPAAKKKAAAKDSEKEEKEEKADKKAEPKKEKAAAKSKTASKPKTAKPDAKGGKIKAEGKSKVATVRKTGGQRGA